MSRRRLTMPRLSYANVAATLALVFALAGGAYAINVGKGAIKTRNIAKGAVKTKKLGNNAVTRTKIANNAVDSSKVGAGSLLAADIRGGQIAVATTGGGAVTPAFAGSFPVAEALVTTDRAGEMLVFGFLAASASCTAAVNCSDIYGLYVDETPVPLTGITVSHNNTTTGPQRTASMFGTTSSIPAGNHTIELRFQQGVTSAGPSISFESKVGALLLGP